MREKRGGKSLCICKVNRMAVKRADRMPCDEAGGERRHFPSRGLGPTHANEMALLHVQRICRLWISLSIIGVIIFRLSPAQTPPRSHFELIF